MGKYFGTDGIRGLVGREIDIILTNKIGFALSNILLRNEDKPKVIIGKDTRISSKMIEYALASSLSSQGIDVVLVGVVATPCVSFLVKNQNFSAGIMISASHNSYEYNGIKIFDNNGFKLSTELENELEKLIDNYSYMFKSFNEIGNIKKDYTLKKIYIDYIKSVVKNQKNDFRICIDCSNGSASYTAYDVFKDTCKTVDVIHCSPNGFNINDKCGSTNIKTISKYVIENNYDFGITFDGDADRCLFVDKKGNVIDGDLIICEIAKYLKSINKLNNDTVVMTVMTNMAVLKYLDEHNIKYKTTTVGDKYVLQNMIENNYSLGGEQSGHIILKDFIQTGDGQLTSLFFVNVLTKLNVDINDIIKQIKLYPQVMKNIKVKNDQKENILNNDDFKILLKSCEDELSDNGRVLVRLSGTEPLIRVMVESIDENLSQKICLKICDFLESKFC